MKKVAGKVWYSIFSIKRYCIKYSIKYITFSNIFQGIGTTIFVRYHKNFC